MAKPIRVLHIANDDDCLGSAQCLYEILRYELECVDIEPVVLTPKHTGINAFCEKNGIKNYVSKYCGFMYPMHDKAARIKYLLRRAEYYLNKNKSVNDIQSKIDFDNIDIIHTNNSLNDIGLRLAKILHKPHVWHLREGGLYQQNLHPYFKDFSRYMNSGDNRFIAVSKAVKAEWIKLGISEDSITVIYDGVALPDKKYKKNSGELVRFVMTGAYSEIKGQIQVIRAVALLPEDYKRKIHIDFWGNGVQEYVEYLKSEIGSNELENIVELKGFTNNVWETLSSYDVGLNCTRLEAFGRTTVEFLINGMPVIASRLGANIELIDDTNGVFYEYANVEDLKRAIMFMVDNLTVFNFATIADKAKKQHTCEISNKNITDYFRQVFEESKR